MPLQLCILDLKHLQQSIIKGIQRKQTVDNYCAEIIHLYMQEQFLSYCITTSFVCLYISVTL